MKMLVSAVALLVLPVSATWAAALDLSLSNDTANLVYVLSDDPLNRQGLPSGNGGSELGLGVFFNEGSDNLLHATLLARGYRKASSSQYQISAGMKLLGGEIGVEDEETSFEQGESVGALALGFQTGLLLKSANFNPVDITFEGFCAPSITSFADAERYGEVSVRLQVEVMTRARAYIGYRRIRFDTNDFENISLDRSAHFGCLLYTSPSPRD